MRGLQLQNSTFPYFNSGSYMVPFTELKINGEFCVKSDLCRSEIALRNAALQPRKQRSAEQLRRCAGSGMLRACRGDDGPRFDMKPVRASSRMLASTSGMPVSPAIQRSSAA